MVPASEAISDQQVELLKSLDGDRKPGEDREAKKGDRTGPGRRRSRTRGSPETEVGQTRSPVSAHQSLSEQLCDRTSDQGGQTDPIEIMETIGEDDEGQNTDVRSDQLRLFAPDAQGGLPVNNPSHVASAGGSANGRTTAGSSTSFSRPAYGTSLQASGRTANGGASHLGSQSSRDDTRRRTATVDDLLEQDTEVDDFLNQMRARVDREKQPASVDRHNLEHLLEAATQRRMDLIAQMGSQLDQAALLSTRKAVGPVSSTGHRVGSSQATGRGTPQHEWTRQSWEIDNPTRSKSMVAEAACSDKSKKGRKRKTKKHRKGKSRDGSTASSSSSSSSSDSDTSRSDDGRKSQKGRLSRKGLREELELETMATGSDDSGESGKTAKSKRSKEKSKSHKKKREKGKAIDYGLAKYLVRGLDRFSAKASDDVDVWIDRFDKATKPMSEQYRQIEFARNMEGQAKVWYNRQTISDREKGASPTVHEWCKRLKKYFEVAPHEHEKNESSYRQRYGQPAREYVQEKLALIDLAHKGYDDARRVRRLLSGVHKAYLDRVEGHVPSIVHSLGIDKIRVFTETLDDEMRVHERNTGGRLPNENFSRANVFNVEEDKRDPVEENLFVMPESTASTAGKSETTSAVEEAARMLRQQMQLSNTFPAGNPYPQNSRYSNSRSYSQRPQQQPRAPFNCYRCGLPGHRAVHCSFPAPGGQSRNFGQPPYAQIQNMGPAYYQPQPFYQPNPQEQQFAIPQATGPQVPQMQPQPSASAAQISQFSGTAGNGRPSQ